MYVPKRGSIVIKIFLAVMRDILGFKDAIFRWKQGKKTSSIILQSLPVVSVADAGITVVDRAGVVEATGVVSWIVVDPGAVDVVVASGVVVGSPIVVG